MKQLAENLWTMGFPLALLGTQVGRRVTVIRLASGELILHSTAPFGRDEIDAIAALGRPAWLVEATLFHDTFARAGRAAFPEALYLAPEGFSRLTRVETTPLSAVPAEWQGEVEVLALQGMPKVREHVFLHRASRTLIVADLVFNFGPEATSWTRFVFRWIAGIRAYPGVGRFFHAMVQDRAALVRSLRRMLAWDFDRVVVGHGRVLEVDAKAQLTGALELWVGA